MTSGLPRDTVVCESAVLCARAHIWRTLSVRRSLIVSRKAER
jgi:hypothetical protein